MIQYLIYLAHILNKLLYLNCLAIVSKIKNTRHNYTTYLNLREQLRLILMRLLPDSLYISWIMLANVHADYNVLCP